MKRILILILMIAILVSCYHTNDVSKDIIYNNRYVESDNGFCYPESKLWKHGVYYKKDARKLEGLFEGLEVDVIYSSEKNDIYVGRVEADTSKNLPLDEWLAVLRKPGKTCYWIDFKNLSYKNANQVFDVLNPLAEKYGIKDVAFVESQDLEALKIAKDNDFHTILWVDNLYYWKNRRPADSVSIVKIIRSKIEKLQPDAISCEYTMFPLLCDSFPEQNIHFWDTPKEYTPENVEFTKKLCENPNVKVVLVDYPTPDVF